MQFLCSNACCTCPAEKDTLASGGAPASRRLGSMEGTLPAPVWALPAQPWSLPATVSDAVCWRWTTAICFCPCAGESWGACCLLCCCMASIICSVRSYSLLRAAASLARRWIGVRTAVLLPAYPNSCRPSGFGPRYTPPTRTQSQRFHSFSKPCTLWQVSSSSNASSSDAIPWRHTHTDICSHLSAPALLQHTTRTMRPS